MRNRNEVRGLGPKMSAHDTNSRYWERLKQQSGILEHSELLEARDNRWVWDFPASDIPNNTVRDAGVEL